MGDSPAAAGLVDPAAGTNRVAFHPPRRILTDRSTCEADYGDQVDASLDTIGARLETAYKARILVLGYPRFLVEGGANNTHSDVYCAAIPLRINDGSTNRFAR